MGEFDDPFGMEREESNRKNKEIDIKAQKFLSEIEPGPEARLDCSIRYFGLPTENATYVLNVWRALTESKVLKLLHVVDTWPEEGFPLLEAIFDGLTDNSSIEVLLLENIDFAEKEYRVQALITLTQALKSRGSTLKLKFLKCAISLGEVRDLANLLEMNNKVLEITMHKCILRPSVEATEDLLEYNESSSESELSSNTNTMPGGEDCADITNQTLKTLRLEACRTEGDAPNVLLEALCQNDTLTELSLHTCVRSETYKSLADILMANSALKILELKNIYLWPDEHGDSEHQTNGTPNYPADKDSKRGKHAPLEVLKLEECGIDKSRVQAIAAAFRQNRTVTELNLTSNEGISSAGAEAVAEMLKDNSTMKTLNMEKCGITADGAKAIATALRKNKTLTKLNLARNEIGFDGVESLLDALCNDGSLKVLELESSLKPETPARTRRQSVTRRRSVLQKMVNLKPRGLHEKIQNEEVLRSKSLLSCLAKLLKTNNTLEALGLSGCLLGPDVASIAACALNNNSRLTELDLSGNLIEPRGAIALAELLNDSHFLTSLKLDGNKIGLDGTERFAVALRANQTLKKLHLRKNEINTEGAISLSKALLQNRCLTELILAANKIKDKGVDAIASALKVNEALEVLDLCNNAITSEGAGKLFEGLKVNKKLIKLRLNANRLGLEGGEKFLETLRDNKTIRDLHLAQTGVKEKTLWEIETVLLKRTLLEQEST